MSIRAYSKELRLQRASQLLRTTYLSIKQVRVQSGIPNGANFVRDFKKRFGMTPSVYRKAFAVEMTNEKSL
jgi:transcriptional regulator GlxA family with amidase domain